MSPMLSFFINFRVMKRANPFDPPEASGKKTVAAEARRRSSASKCVRPRYRQQRLRFVPGAGNKVGDNVPEKGNLKGAPRTRAPVPPSGLAVSDNQRGI